VRARATNGTEYHNSSCGIVIIRDSKIQTVREYLDSHYAAQTLLT
jgi:ketosteroid isomerase-like protein